MIINKKIALVILAVMAASTTLMFGDVKLEELPNKGYRVATDTYTATLDGTGTLTSLMVAGVEFLAPPRKAVYRTSTVIPAIYVSVSRIIYDTPKSLTGPVTREGDSLLCKGDGWWLRYTFKPDGIDLEYAGHPAGLFALNEGYPSSDLTFNLSPDLDRASDPLEQGDLGWPITINPEPGNYAIIASNGAALVFEKADWTTHLDQPDVLLDPPHRLDVVTFSEVQKVDVIKRSIRVFPKPDLSHSIEMKIISPNPDHLFSKTDEVVFPVEVTAHYGQSLKGKIRFEGSNYVWTKDKVTAEVPIELSPEHPTQKINLTIRPAKPGQIVGKVMVIDGETPVYAKRIGFMFQPERIAPVKVPKDFDAFWDETMTELAKVPLDMTLTEQKDKETALGKVYLVKYRSWEGRWAWAWLNEPKGNAKVDGIVRSPAVSVYQPGIAQPATGELRINVAIHGGDITNYPAKSDFDYMNDGWTSRETPKLRYGYCCLARCYDIIKNHRLCNGIVHAVGSSQGGGLSLVLGGLRPVTDITVHNLALCRIDWTILGYTTWGPHAPTGSDPAQVAEFSRYYEPACFAHRIHAPITFYLGLFDFTGPVEGVFTAINALPPDTRCRVMLDPYGGHFTSDFSKREGVTEAVEIPRWQGTDADNKLNH